MPPVLYAADVVAPMVRPPLADGGVLVDGGRVVAVGAARALRADAARVHEVSGVLLPGLVNARTHLEHADARALARPGQERDWSDALADVTGGWSDERWERSAHRGVLQTLRAGTSWVGDVVTAGTAVPASYRAGLAGDSWVRVAGVDRHGEEAVLAGVGQALRLPAPGRRVGLGVAGVHTLGSGVLTAVADLARTAGVPLHVSCARSADEIAAIRHGLGPLADAARAAGSDFEWLDGGTGTTPVTHLDACGALGPATSLAHGVWVEPEDPALLAERGVAVVACPRSNDLLGVGHAPLERYADAGVALALGTDTPAACPDGDVLAEAAAWRRLARARGLTAWPGPGGPVDLDEQAIRLATVDGARAMGWDAGGVLETGRRADLVGVAVDTTADRVYRDLVERGAGRQVVAVVAGVRKARRAHPDDPWPEIDDDAWR